MKLIISLITTVLLLFCASGDKKGDGYIYVQNIKGLNLDDAELNAKREIIAKGLGELIEGSSQVLDGEAKEKILEASVEGYVIDYQQIGPDRKKEGMVIIDAKGKVNANALKNALETRYKDVGRPRFLMIVDETINGRKSSGNVNVTENAMVSKFTIFDFLDREQFKRILTKEAGKSVGIYGDARLEAKALDAAAEMEAEILLIGQSETKNIGKIMDSDLNSIQSTVRFKLVDVGSASILAADNAGAAAPHVDPERGAQDSIDKALEKALPKIKEQIERKWKRGTTIRLTIEGLNYDDYVDNGTQAVIRKIKGVNEVNERSSGNVNNMISLEVKALFAGPALYRKLREWKEDLKFDFTQKEVKNNSVHIIVKKK